MAQVCRAPALIWTNCSPPATRTGVVLLTLVPSPSWPSPLAPQHQAAPLPVSAQVWEPPAAMAVKTGRVAAVTAAEPGSGAVGESASSRHAGAASATTVKAARRGRGNAWNRMAWPAFDGDAANL